MSLQVLPDFDEGLGTGFRNIQNEMVDFRPGEPATFADLRRIQLEGSGIDALVDFDELPAVALGGSELEEFFKFRRPNA